MAHDILMPSLSPSMTEGKLARWLVKVGDHVVEGASVAEIETDKATLDLEAPESGVVAELLVPDGTEGVPVNTRIAILVEKSETYQSVQTAVPASKASSDNGDNKLIPALGSTDTDGSDNRVFASPVARAVARVEGLDLSQLTGRGPRGRIVKADVERHLATAPGSAPAATAVVQPAMPGISVKPHSMMRKTIARRLKESKQTIPHFYLTASVNMDALLGARTRLNSRSDTYRISVNDFVIKATGAALRKVPEANAMWTDDALHLFDDVSVSVAVATDGGLITPIIRNVDQKGLVEISAEMKELAGRARANKLKPEEYQGGGFSISNLGMYGVEQFNAIINPPQSAILAVGAAEQRAVVKDGAFEVATMMTITLSVDHRSIDGAVAATLLSEIKTGLEDPVTMIL